MTLPSNLKNEAEKLADEYSSAIEYSDNESPKTDYLAGFAACFTLLTKAPEGFEYKVWKPSEIAKLVNEISTAFISLNDHKAALAQLHAENERLLSIDESNAIAHAALSERVKELEEVLQNIEPNLQSLEHSIKRYHEVNKVAIALVKIEPEVKRIRQALKERP